MEARESEKEIVAFFASWVRMGTAMVASMASTAPTPALERLGLERRSGVDGMALSLLVPDETNDPAPPC